MSKSGTFGDHVTSIAICTIFNVNFKIISTLGEIFNRDVGNEDSDITLHLGYMPKGRGEHYKALHGLCQNQFISSS
jgi:hypothetical protein